MTRHIWIAMVAVVLTATLMVYSATASTANDRSLGIDIGSEWLKMALVEPAGLVNMIDVVLDEQSQRRTPSLAAFDGDDRLIGAAAESLSRRNPARVLPALKRLLGCSPSGSNVVSYRHDYPSTTLTSWRHNPSRVAITIGEHHIGVEEGVAMILQHSLAMAREHARVLNGLDTVPVMNDIVLTAPEWFTQSQRDLLSQLASLAGFKVQAVIGELTAVAIDFATRNGAEEPQYIVFMSIGTHGANAALAHISRAAGKLAVKILATSSDATISGLTIDIAIRDILAADFDRAQAKAKNGAKQSITTNVRAMNKLLRAAQNAKEELSVGTSVGVSLDEVFEGKNLATSITREQLETIIAPLLAKVTAPIAAVLSQSSIDISKVSAIEAFGGVMRMPAILAAIRTRYPSVTVARHVDGDESLVFGAAHYSAVLNGVPRATVVTIEEAALPAGSSALLSTAEHASVVASLQLWTSREAQRAAVDAARNAFESQLVAARDIINGDRLKKQSKELKASAESLVAEVSSWFDDNSSTATLEEFTTRSATFQSSLKSILDVAPAASVKPNKLDGASSTKRKSSPSAAKAKAAHKKQQKAAADKKDAPAKDDKKANDAKPSKDSKKTKPKKEEL